MSDLAKFKKSDLTKSKKLNLAKSKKSTLSKDFAKANSSWINSLIFEAKKTFINLWNTFTKTPISRHFDPKYHV